MKLSAKISEEGTLLYRVSILIIFGILMVAGFSAFLLCVDNPRIIHIADNHIDALANGLMTYASISVGFLLTELALLLTFSSSPFFVSWQRSGKYKVWISLNSIALFSSIGVLVSSFILLGWESTLPFVMGLLAVNALSMLFVFIPLFIVAGKIMGNKDSV